MSTPHLFFFLGEDTLSRREALESKLNELLPPAERALGLQVFRAPEAGVQAVAESVLSVSMFGSAAVIVVKNCADIKTTEARSLFESLAGYDLQNYLVLDGDTLLVSGNGKPKLEEFLKTLKIEAQFETFPLPRPHLVADWVQERIRRKFKRSLDMDLCRELADRVGNDLPALNSTLEKLDIAVPRPQEITGEHLDQYVAGTRAKDTWEIQNILGRRELGPALTLLEQLRYQNTDASPVLYSIYRHFLMLFRLRLFFTKYPEKHKNLQAAQTRLDRKQNWAESKAAVDAILLEAGSAAGLLSPKQPKSVYPKMIIPKIVEQARRFSQPEYLCILRKIEETERGIKGWSNIPEKIQMENLAIGICHSFPAA
jgi:DNA polymerase III delta subunit